MRTRTLLYRLLFTRDDDLDLLQVFFLLAILFFGTAFGLEAVGLWHPSAQAWSMFRLVFVILAIAGTPMWVAKLISAYLTGKASPDAE